MKVKILVCVLCVWWVESVLVKGEEKKNIDNSFLQNELSEYSSLKLWVNNYIAPADISSFHLEDRMR